jgi:hypothetical protein
MTPLKSRRGVIATSTEGRTLGRRHRAADAVPGRRGVYCAKGLETAFGPGRRVLEAIKDGHASPEAGRILVVR